MERSSYYKPTLDDLSKVDPHSYRRDIERTQDPNFSLLQQSVLFDNEKRLVKGINDMNKSRNNKEPLSQRNYIDKSKGVPGHELERRTQFYSDKLTEAKNIARKKADIERSRLGGVGANSLYHNNSNIGSTFDQTRFQSANDIINLSSSKLDRIKQSFFADQTKMLDDSDIQPQFERLDSSHIPHLRSQLNLPEVSPPKVQMSNYADYDPLKLNRSYPKRDSVMGQSSMDPVSKLKTSGPVSFSYNRFPTENSVKSEVSGYNDIIKDMLNKREHEADQLRQKVHLLEQENQSKNKLLQKYMEDEKPAFRGAPPAQGLPPAPAFSSDNLGDARFPDRRKNTRPDAYMSYLLQNEARHMDLNDYERTFVFMNAQEADNLRMMMGVPVGTDLYRFKAEQYKETSTTRAEVEKLVYEQMLRSMKKGFEAKNRENDKLAENLKWTDEQRRMLIAGRLRKDLAAWPKLEFNKPPEIAQAQSLAQLAQDAKADRPRNYDPTEGFIVYWDYCLGMPKMQNYTNFDFQIVNNGEIIYDTEELKIAKNIPESEKTQMSIFGYKSIIRGIPANNETLMIWKVRQPVSESNSEECTEIGWTQIDLFDVMGNLKRGFWKCPLYELPYSTKITKEGVQQLTPIFGNWFYLRISFPWGDEYTNGSLIPTQSSSKADIPEMHLRAANWRPKIQPKEEDPPIELDDDNKPKAGDPAKDIQIAAPDTKDKGPIDEENVLLKKPKTPEPEPDEAPPMPTQKKGVLLEIQRVTNYVAESHMKVAVSCYQDKMPIIDDTRIAWKRNTIIHNPFMGLEKEGLTVVDSNEVKQGLMDNLAKDGDVIFKDQLFNLYRNLPILLAKSKMKLFLVFALLEKPPPTEVLQIKNSGYSGSEKANLGGMEYITKGYGVFELSNENLTDFLVGQKKIPLYQPTFRIPPYDYENKAKRMLSDSHIYFNIMDNFYDNNDVQKEYMRFRVARPIVEKKDQENIYDPGKTDVVADNRPYIPNTTKQYGDNTFAKGYGVDFYFDGLRFLPDNATIVKVIIRVVSSEYKDVLKPCACLPKFVPGNDTFNPFYNFRHEFRSEFFDPTSLILMTFVSIDKANLETRIVGYGAINLFERKYRGGQPENPNESDIVLRSGSYQLSIYSQEPLRTKPFNIDKIRKLVELPCASALIRIKLAPLSNDLKRVLSIRDYKHLSKKELKKMGIYESRPLYSEGKYNNKLNLVSDNDMQLFRYRAARAPVELLDSMNLVLRINNINKEMTEVEMHQWCNMNIKYGPDTMMLDPMFFARYTPQSGFKIAIDAIHKVPDNVPYVITYTLNPPGEYYKYDLKDPTVQPDTSHLELNAQIDWNRPLGLLKFHDGWKYYIDVEYNPYLHIIVQVKRVITNSDRSLDLKDVGWCIIPIFHGDQYVVNGHYQMPIYKGTFPYEDLLELLTKNEPFSYVEQMRKDKKGVKWLGDTSILFRLLDNQKEGQLEDAKNEGKLSVKTLDFRYLPDSVSGKTKFAYNDQVERNLQNNRKWRTIVPDQGDETDYNTKIISFAVEEIGMSQYETK